MEFCNRSEDLASLRRALADGDPQLIRLYGRRRVGKTEMLRQLLREHPGIYLSAAPGDTLPQVRDLTEQLGDQLQRPLGPFTNWAEFFQALRGAGSPLVIIDEFQNLIDRDLHVAGVLQRIWDTSWSKHGPHLVLSGSSIGRMLRLTRYRTGPLYGRFTHDLHLRPFSYDGVRLLYPHETEEGRVRRFAVFGRTPAYHAQSVGKSLEDAIVDSWLAQDARFRHEPFELLLTEVRTLDRYSSIMTGLGRGPASMSDLEHQLGVKGGGISRYLEVLVEDLDLVRRSSPTCGMFRRSRYELADPFFRFFYRFVHPNRSLLERGGEGAVLSRIRAGLEDHVGRAFEDVVHDVLGRSHGMEVRGRTFRFDEVGRWWNRLGEEIDVVALDPHEVWCGEVTWSERAVPEGVVRDLLRKSALLERTDARPIRPFLVARGGATTEARALLQQRGGFLLTLEDLEEMAAHASGNGPSR